uniref:Leucine rich repeat and fibronectin type III domain containing 1 n=1 Tax=Cyanoderma ruficeps TaxID=181631 RepID=A0A8C3QL09_9PASS
MAKLLVPLVVLGAVSGAGVPVSPPSPRCPPRCLCPAAAPSPTLLCARTGLLAVPPSLDRGAVELRLADNFIGAVGRSDFANMSSLVHLTLSRNGLRRLAPGAFADLRALRALHLDGNRLPALSGPQLRGLASLRHLILANNQLAAIDAAAFAAFAATVEDLDLSHNNLPALPWDAVAAMGSLATLTLDHNLLERVPAGAVARLPRLARLDLTANRLRALPPVPGPPGPALAAGGNPLHCNCELLWLRRVATPGRLETCATPAPLAGRLLGAVPEEELTCRAPAVTAAAAHPAAVTEGQPLRLGCAAVGDPPPALHWLGPDGRLVQNGSRRSVGADGSLELRVATLRDHGGFTCVAANAAGEAAARVDVVVVPLPVPRGRDGDGDVGETAAAEAGGGPGPSDMAQAGGNDTWGGPGERRVVAAEVTGSSARIRWLPQRHVPGVRMVQIQYNSSADDALVYRWGGRGRGVSPRGGGGRGWAWEGSRGCSGGVWGGVLWAFGGGCGGLRGKFRWVLAWEGSGGGSDGVWEGSCGPSVGGVGGSG